jgi:hypothetical protein
MQPNSTVYRHEIPRVHKLILRSCDAAEGSTNANAIFYNVRLPEMFRRQCVMQVSTFDSLNNDSNTTLNQVWELSIDGFDHPNSWESAKGGYTNTLLVNSGYYYDQQTGTNNLTSTVILDPSAMTSKTLTVRIKTPLNPGFAWTVPWTLVLVLYERSDSEILS